MTNQESPQRERERLAREELKNNPTGTMKDAYDRATIGNLGELVSTLGWKGIAIIILIILMGIAVKSIFF
ncbi:DUF6366 family protein [Paenibacillus tundrae]|uniref:Phage capsid protein n=1 Tax=Paenibacillus tundrae TaxID=528187 RepID=A0ABT9WIX6_9BACL|nr:DUF6366 family protein [Paenibacillus tundrae]MDQ0173120.1 hypothetical protein [Paenibacillus tundrae]